MVCLLVWCSAVFGDEDIERMLEMYAQQASLEQRLREYEALQEMRRARGERHLPAGSQFDFARENFRLSSQGTGDKDALGCAWTSAGPTNLNGRVNSVAVDPDQPKNIYAATVGGLWRSTDTGRRWQRVSDDLLADRWGPVAVNPAAPNEVLAAMGDPCFGVAGKGLYRSTAYGVPGSWTKVTTEFDSKIVYRIRFNPSKFKNDVYVAASNGVWLGTHDAGGITFKQDVFDNFDAPTHDIAIDFSSPAFPTIYAGVRKDKGSIVRGIYKWNWGLNQWERKDSGIPVTDSGAISLALSKSDPSILYAKVAMGSDNDKLIGLFKTTTAGEPGPWGSAAWSPLPLGGNCGVPDEWGWYNTMLEVDPDDPERVFAGGTDVWMSTNGGACWDNVSKGTDPAYPLPAHADVHTLAFDPSNPKIVYVGTDGGIDRSTDTSQALWHWNDVSHGMIITMFWTLTSNRAYPTLLAGGMQDNGTSVTFGNRTWYQPGGGDGYDVGTDAGNPDSIYSYGGGVFYELVNPTPGTPGGYDPTLPPGNGPVVPWTGDKPTSPPLITDITKPHSALAGGGPDCGQRTIVKTEDGVNWKAIPPTFPDGGTVIALASAPSDDFKTYLAAVAYKQPAAPCIVPLPFNPYVIRIGNGGTAWGPVTGLPTYGKPSSLEFDPNDSSRSYVTYSKGGHRIYMSTGGAYTQIAGSGSDMIPADVRRVVVDPSDKNVLYAATSVGVFRGTLTVAPPADPTAIWEPFDQGLPDGLEINGLWVDPQTGILTIGTFGFGAFRRDISGKGQCAARMLVVRDTVYDDGREPSLSEIPDAEHPISDFPSYKPDDTVAGMASWWTSRDIRIDVPSKNPPANTIPDADSVEFEQCPTAVGNCPPQSMIDSAPEASKDARVYVQVTNRGVEAVNKVRVIALWNTAGAAFDKLPETFWTKTFPPDGAACGPLDPGTGWKLVDPEKPCRTIKTVTPEVPELARFNWDVPQAADGGATMLTVVESQDDELEKSIRAENKLYPSEIVPGSRHIALRGLRVLDLGVREPFLWPLDLLHLPEEMSEVEVVVSKPDLPDGVRLVLPKGLTAKAGFGSARQTRVTEAELVRKLETMGLDPNNAWEFNGNEASLFVDLRPGERVTTGVIATRPDIGATSRVSIVERSRGKIVGGSVMLLRPKV